MYWAPELLRTVSNSKWTGPQSLAKAEPESARGRGHGHEHSEALKQKR